MYRKAFFAICLNGFALAFTWGITVTNIPWLFDRVGIKETDLGIWFNIGYFIFANRYLKQMNYHSRFKDFLSFLAKNKKMKTFKHKGKHITINTISELEKARQQIIKFI